MLLLRRIGVGFSNVKTILRHGRMKAVAILVASLYGLLFLTGTQNIVYLPNVDFRGFVTIPSIVIADDWPSKIWRMRAPANWEPVIAIYPLNHVMALISVPNILITAGLAILVGLNATVAVYGLWARVCSSAKRKAFPGVFGAIPGFLSGFGCCAPTAATVLGATTVVGLIALANYLIPISFIALVSSLIWSAGRDEICIASRVFPGEERQKEGPLSDLSLGRKST